MTKQSVLRQSTKKKQGSTDFKRLKFKVGRKLPQAANATQTKFKAKRVVMREQSVAVEASQDVASRMQTVEQLASLTMHHHQRVRAEAFEGLLELAQRRNAKIVEQFAEKLGVLAKGMSDGDALVREAFRRMLVALLDSDASWMPLHLDMLMKHVVATLTSAEGLSRRLDATLVVEILASKMPALMQAQAARLLPLFADVGRSVLGTSSSALAKGAPPVPTVLVQGTLGILKTMREEDAAAAKKRKRVKKHAGNASEAVKMELADNSARLMLMTRAIGVMCALAAERVDALLPADVEELARVAVLVFRDSGDEAAGRAVAAAMALAVQCRCAHVPAVARDVRDAMAKPDGFAMKLVAAQCSVWARHGLDAHDAWLARCWAWLEKALASKDADVRLDALVPDVAAAAGIDAAAPLLQAVADRFVRCCASGSPESMAAQLGVLERVGASAACLEALPRLLWRAGKDTGEYDVIGKALKLLAARALAGAEAVDWAQVAKGVAALMYATRGGTAVPGPAAGYSREHWLALCGVVAALPVVPRALLKSAVAVQRFVAEDKGDVLAESVFAHRAVEADARLSFALSLGVQAQRSRLAVRSLKHWALGWPLGELLAPAVLECADVVSEHWVRVAVLCAAVAPAISALLAEALGRAFERRDEAVAEALVGVVEPMRGVRAAAVDCDAAVAGWFAFVATRPQLMRSAEWGFVGHTFEDDRLQRAGKVADVAATLKSMAM